MDYTTTLLLSNLHCNSCVQAVKEVLSSLLPHPLNVQVSIPSQSVSIIHPRELSLRSIRSAIEDAGFYVQLPQLSESVDIESSVSQSKTLDRHLQYCTSCRLDSAKDASHLDSYQKNGISFKNSIDSKGMLTEIDQKDSEESPDSETSFRLSISIGGMSCSSCVVTITQMVSELPGISDLSVNLISKSATLTIQSRNLASLVSETVENCGFEVEIVSIEPILPTALDKSGGLSSQRTVSLRVDGMFCQHCPDKVTRALQTFGSKVSIVKSVTSFKEPIIIISYEPSSPSFTIRNIIDVISSSKSPPFQVTISRPPSIEERARVMHLQEQRDLLLRLIFTVVIAIPTFIIEVVYMSLIRDGNSIKSYFLEPMWTGNTSRADWAMFFLATAVMFYSAGIFHSRGMKDIWSLWRSGSTTPIFKRFYRFGSMNLLISAGVSVAYFSSVALLSLAAIQEPFSTGGRGDNTTYFDSVVFLTMFLLAGRFLEAYSKGRTADAVTALCSLRPKEALVLVPRAIADESVYCSGDPEKGDETPENDDFAQKSGFVIQKVGVDLLEVGDIVRVQFGSTPPADGTIISEGNTAFDESSLTGESRLVKKSVGDTVYLGTINKSKVVEIRIGAIGGETMLDHIVQIVRESQTRRAPIERLADLLTSYFVPVVTLLAITTWVIWLILGLGGVLPQDYLDIAIGGWPVWSLEFAVSVFVVACPCGIGLAAPTALLVGSGVAAKFGILAKGGGEAFQDMASIDLVVFDKTGTLTKGVEPKVANAEVCYPDSKLKREVILGIAAEMESESATSHPLAKAIREFCGAQGASPAIGTGFEETAGRGLKAKFESEQRTAIIGNEAWMQEHGVYIDEGISQRLDLWKSETKSVVLLAVGDHTPAEAFELAAVFSIVDPLRPEAKDVVHCLQKYGIQTWMISGDNITTAQAVAQMVGIPAGNVIAGVLPHEKAEKINWLQRTHAKRPRGHPSWQILSKNGPVVERCIVAMVGDGINDAPAITSADVGIAIGSGSDVAIASASFILVSSNLRSLLVLCNLSRTVFNRVKFNFLWAIMYNLAAVPIAAGVLYPAGHIRLAPVWASLAMALSSVSVVCSSLLLKFYKEPRM